MTQEKILSTDEIATGKFLVWCREYDRHGNFPCNALKRFAIAFYQVYQGIAWHGTPNADESYMACVVHLVCMCEHLDVDLYKEIGEVHLSFLPYTQEPIDPLTTLVAFSQVQQMLVYQSTQYSRSSRYKKLVVQKQTGVLIKMLLARIPKKKRREALHKATSIMTKDL